MIFMILNMNVKPLYKHILPKDSIQTEREPAFKQR
jgi:hypothetical protein